MKNGLNFWRVFYTSPKNRRANANYKANEFLRVRQKLYEISHISCKLYSNIIKSLLRARQPSVSLKQPLVADLEKGTNLKKFIFLHA